ncbi:MAG: hypothetical protein MAG551_01941 [Candidatus Scalindua arabica]|uniref:HNH nuclease domain-containing protein n=1 Tax=Candidatus Scalindua arabica TaxID=1127984 RepID=A0A941W4A1_9BACT|nr:hypothetical protein [Candidatus Scalindua arabica]
MNTLDHNLQTFIKRFQNLRVDRSLGIAPHKPILLLTIIENIENKNIFSNKVFITSEIVASFKKNWSLLVKTNHNISFALPFYHLRSDKFWTLKPKVGFENALNISSAMRGFKNLNQVVDYAEINEDLFELLANEDSRNILRFVILNTYFPETKINFISNYGKGYKRYIESIENKILKESAIRYKQEFENLDDEDIFIRSDIFKKVVPRIYSYTCCISELNISALANISMIDACHIVPFSVSHDDTIKNGISLCPNLHRAFDRGLISIDAEYKVIVSNCFTENSESDYGIIKYKGKRMMLLMDQQYWPDRENLKWHRKNVLLNT